MIKGGYKIIDFKGTALSGTAVTMTDILESLKDNYEKVVLLTGIVIGDDAMDDCFSTPIPDGDDGFKLNAYDGYILVTKAGSVTYTEASIETLNRNVDRILSAGNVTIGSDESLAATLSSLKNYESMSGRVVPSYFNTLFGINKNGTIVVTRMAATVIYIRIFDHETGHICTGRCTVSSGVITWTARYIYEGTAYTPA